MKRFLAFPISIAVALAPAVAQDLPEADESFEVEPPLLIQSRPDEPLPAQSASTTPAPRPDVEQLEKDLEHARKSAVSAEHLYKAGVLAKVEAEKRALRVVRLQADLANARLSDAKENVASQQGRFEAGEISKAEVDGAESALREATAAVQIATTDFKRAELEAAVINLRRQQKLLALGSARKSDVARAEEKVAALQRNPQ